MDGYVSKDVEATRRKPSRIVKTKILEKTRRSFAWDEIVSRAVGRDYGGEETNLLSKLSRRPSFFERQATGHG